MRREKRTYRTGRRGPGPADNSVHVGNQGQVRPPSRTEEPRIGGRDRAGREQNSYREEYVMTTQNTCMTQPLNASGPQHETRIMPAAADVLALAEHYGVAFIESDGWVNAMLAYPGGSTVVYKAPTDAAVS